VWVASGLIVVIFGLMAIVTLISMDADHKKDANANANLNTGASAPPYLSLST